MPKFTAQELQDLAQDFIDIGGAVAAVRLDAIRHGKPLSDPEIRSLLGLNLQLEDLGATFAAKAGEVTLDDTAEAIATIEDATTKANNALETLKKLDKAITIATDAVTLAASVFTGDPKQIATSVKALILASLPSAPARDTDADTDS